MKYALGNMLNGAGGLNADQLALDLQFAADKTLTARKGPTPILTRGSTGTFVGSNGLIQTAAVNAARFDHDPVSPFACRGLLIEEGRTNLTVRSDDFGASEWNQGGSSRNLTVTANNTESPSGATDADLLTVGATTTTYQVAQALPATGNVTSGTAYTISCYFKPNQVTRVSIWAGNPVTLPADAIFDLTGAGSVVANALGTASIQQAGNGWYRCIVTGTAGATSNTSLRFSPASGVSRVYVGNSVDSFWAWGAQLEAGSFPTSYIPTTTSALARSADVCSITGTNFTSTNFYNPSAGTIIAIGSLNTTNTNPATVALKVTDGSDNNRIQIGMTNVPNEGVRPFIVASGTLTYSSTTGTATIGVERKIGTAYSTNDAISVFNGTLGTQDITVTMPTGINQALIGVSFGNGTIASLRYFKKRLPNAKLQALTA